jgi:rhodanese-related sulfurtransferase
MVKVFFNFVFAAIFLFPGCSIGLSDNSLSYLTPEGVETLLSEGAGTLFDADARVVVVDPRPMWSYGQGHISGAINIPFGQLNSQIWKLEGAGVIVVAGETHNDSVAIAMSKRLIKLGFSNVKTLRGGLTGWEDAGHAVVTAE